MFKSAVAERQRGVKVNKQGQKFPAKGHYSAKEQSKRLGGIYEQA